MKYRWKKCVEKEVGVLCGAEKSQEWLLPWWWSRYQEHNAFPVTFIDFGMSEKMKAWCRERGELCSVELEHSCISSRDSIDPNLIKEWESIYGQTMWNSRPTWFKKPFALLNSSYERAIWIDLDCEVLGPLDSLFLFLGANADLALVREYTSDHLPRFDPRVRYNGGVIVFQHGARIIEKWAEAAIDQNHLFAGDDSLLSHLIHKHHLDVIELPEIYNWRMVRGLNLNAVILHWVGNGGKAYIRKHGGLKPSLDALYGKVIRPK